MKIQKEFDPIQGITTAKIEKTREDVTPVVEYKKFISKGIEITNSDGETEVVNQRVEAVLPENGPRSTLFQTTLSDGTDVKAAVKETVAKAIIEYAEKNGQRSVIEMKYRQPTGEAKAAVEEDTPAAVAKPVISINEDGNVTITAAAGDIHYTTDGSNPTSASTKYTASFSVEDGTTVKAIAIVKEENEETGEVVEKVSSVATKKYIAAGSSDPIPSGSFVVYKGTPVLSYDRMEDQFEVGTYFEEAITPELIKSLTKSTVTNVYQDLTFTGTDEDDSHMSTAVYAVPASAEPIKPGIMFYGELKESTGYHKFNVTIDGVEYVVFALKAGLADASTIVEVYFRPSFD